MAFLHLGKNNLNCTNDNSLIFSIVSVFQYNIKIQFNKKRNLTRLEKRLSFHTWLKTPEKRVKYFDANFYK